MRRIKPSPRVSSTVRRAVPRALLQALPRMSSSEAGPRSPMIIGVPKEIKDNEARVGVTPAGVKALTEAGHKVLVETHAGELSGFTDADYQDAGGEVVGEAG